MNKTCLFLKAAAAACADEADVISAHLKSMHVDTELIEWISIDDFTKRVVGKKFEIIYLGAHADCSGFGESNGTLHPWENLGAAICGSDCMVPEGTLFLGCCRGGMKTVALKILKQCAKIDYVMGPNWKSKGGNLATAFAAFTRSRLINSDEPAEAAERASKAVGQVFTCYDRQELEAELELLNKLGEIAHNQLVIYQIVSALRDDITRISDQLGLVGTAPDLESTGFDELFCCPPP